MSYSESRSNTSGRVQFEWTPDRVAEIDRLKLEGGFDSRKDLVNNAIALLKWAMRHAEKGRAIGAIDEKSDKYFELQMPFLDHIASSTQNRG